MIGAKSMVVPYLPPKTLVGRNQKLNNYPRPGGYEGRKEKDNEENIIQQGPGCGWRNPGEPDGCQDGDGGEAPHRRGNAGRTAIPAGDHPLCRMG